MIGMSERALRPAQLPHEVVHALVRWRRETPVGWQRRCGRPGADDARDRPYGVSIWRPSQRGYSGLMTPPDTQTTRMLSAGCRSSKRRRRPSETYKTKRDQ